MVRVIGAGVAGVRAGARKLKGVESQFVICVRNDGHPASLELHKGYRLLEDEPASRRGLVRVVDESGEDYLYPEEYFLRQ
jgi:hypothetical protein